MVKLMATAIWPLKQFLSGARRPPPARWQATEAGDPGCLRGRRTTPGRY